MLFLETYAMAWCGHMAMHGQHCHCNVPLDGRQQLQPAGLYLKKIHYNGWRCQRMKDMKNITFYGLTCCNSALS
jgi:hypothetical protein